MAKKAGLICVICGPRDFDDYDAVKTAIKESGFKICEVVSGGAKGADELGERWAKENKIKLSIFKADWDDLTAKGAIIKENKWGKKYNANSGFARNQKMANYADAIIAINKGNTPGTSDMIKRAKNNNLKIFVYEIEKADTEYEYHF